MGDYRQVTLADLAKMDDGRLAKAFDQELKRIALDCEDRPADDRTRKLTLQLEVVPVLEDDGTCSELKMKAQFKSTVPTRQSKPYSLNLRKNGIMAYRPHSEDNHEQSNFLGNETGGDNESEWEDV